MLKVSRRKVLPLLAGALGARGVLHAGPAMAEGNGFPADFVWGASTSAYQIEGAVDADGRGKSIWDVFCRTPGKVKNGDTGDVACDHYHRWRDDVALLAHGGFNAYRFSVAWPRILPAGAGAVETRGLDFYDRLVDGLLARNITPWACLYHWDLPQALQDKGGWLTRDIAEKFADYARVVSRRLGDRVKHWAMFNEPGVHALFGYGMGNHAPGLTGLANMLAAIHHQNLAQGHALQALRAERADFRLGTVLSLQPVRPSSDSEADRAAVARFDAVWDGAFLDPLFRGFYPPAIADDIVPLVAAGDLQTIRQPVDFLGVNYYAPAWVTAAPGSLFGAWFGAVPEGTRFTAMGWPIDAGGLTDIAPLARRLRQSGTLCDRKRRLLRRRGRRRRHCARRRSHRLSARARRCRPRGAGRRRQASRLFRLVAVGQFRMGGRLQPSLRHYPRRLCDPAAGAENVVCIFGRYHQAARIIPPACFGCDDLVPVARGRADRVEDGRAVLLQHIAH